MKKILSISIFLFLLINFSGMVSASVVSGYVNKGYWIRGTYTPTFTLRSEYKATDDGYEGHASSVDSGGEYKSGGWKSKDVFSNATQQYLTGGGNKAYYDYR